MFFHARTLQPWRFQAKAHPGPGLIRFALLAPALLAAAIPALARDLSCSEYGSGKSDVGWIHTLPERGQLPHPETVEKLGAVMLLDEVIYTGGENCIDSKIAELGSQESLDEFGSEWIYADSGRALIRGRVQRLDGTVRELTGDDIQCSTVGEGSLLSNETTSKQYVIHFPELSSGTLIHSQVKRQCGSVPSLFPAWLGTGDHPHTTALEVRHLINVLSGQEYQIKIYPDGADVKVSELPSQASGSKKMILISSRRPVIPRESFAPWVYSRSPLVMVRDRSNVISRDFKWEDLVNIVTGQLDLYTKSSSPALDAVYMEGRISSTLPPMELIRRVHAYLRDQVTEEPAELSRNSSYRPLMNIVSQARTATPFEKRAAEIALMRTLGHKAYWAYARNIGQQPIDKAQPDFDWFNNYFVVLEFEGKRYFLDPTRRLSFGELPSGVQGGEAMLIRERKNFEWITLPVMAAEDYRIDAELTVSGGTGTSLSGMARFTLRGGHAFSLREDLEESSPREVRSKLESWFSNLAAPGVTFSNIQHLNLNSPDEPLVLTAEFQYAGAVVPAGRKAFVGLQPVRMSPTADSFIAVQRTLDIDFGNPDLRRTVFRLPRKRFAVMEPPAPVKVSGPGIEYQRRAAFEGDELVVTRELRLEGVIRSARYPEVREAMRKITDADESPLEVTR